MPTSKCPTCSHHSFEMRRATKIVNSKHAYSFVQCAKCGAVVGVTEEPYIPMIIEYHGNKLGIKFDKRLGS